MTDRSKIIELREEYERFLDTLPVLKDGENKDPLDWWLQKISQARAEERSKLLLELLQVFNDYDVPFIMIAEQVRDILEEYLTKKE